jgi:hypothetical protein
MMDALAKKMKSRRGRMDDTGGGDSEEDSSDSGFSD